MRKGMRTLLLAAAGCATGVFLYRLGAGHGVIDALLWGVGGGMAGAAVLWLAGVGRAARSETEAKK